MSDNSKSQPIQKPRRSSIFDWAFSSFGSPPTGTQATGFHQRSNSCSLPERRPSLGGSAAMEEDAISSPATGHSPPPYLHPPQHGKVKPRALSQSSISHDEALNLARAGMIAKTAQDGNEERQNKPLNRRPSKQGTYEGMGLVAAYSGGPSDF
jgi:hypothetical protein